MKKQKDQKKQNPVSKKQNAKNTKADNWKYWVGFLILALVAYIVYSPSFTGAFVWDDDDYIRNNPLAQSINLKEIFSQFTMGNYHPFTMLGFAIEYKFFGLEPMGYHKVNLLIHILNSILVFYTIKMLCEKPLVGFIAALLFAIHPLHVESVAWISELKDLLYTFFFLCSYIYYLKYLKENKNKYYLFSILLFLFSLLSKAMAACLPVLLILTDYFKGRKINFKSLLEKAPYFILAIILGIVAVFAQKESGATDITVFTLPQRIVFACYGFVAYLFKLILPLNLCAYYDYPIKSGGQIPSAYYLSVLIFIALIAFVFYSRKSSNKIFFGVGLFAITVFLVLQLLPVGGAIMADRYSYVPSIGIFYLAGEAFYWLWNRKSSTLKFPALILLFGFTIFFSVKTYARCDVWQNGMVLWNNVISQYQTIPQAYINRGVILAKENRDQEAMDDYGKAIKLGPEFDKAYNNRGILLAKLLKYDEALKDYNKAIELNPKYASAYNNRGVMYKVQGNYLEAIANYDKAVEYKPTYLEAYYNRAVALRNIAKYDEALLDFNKALQLNPNYVNAFAARGILYMNQLKYDDAMNDFNKAIKIEPGFALAYSHRGSLNKILKDINAAIRDYSKAIELQPSMSEAYYNRGLLEYDSGNKAEGCKDIKQAASMGVQAAIAEASRICQ